MTIFGLPTHLFLSTQFVNGPLSAKLRFFLLANLVVKICIFMTLKLAQSRNSFISTVFSLRQSVFFRYFVFCPNIEQYQNRLTEMPCLIRIGMSHAGIIRSMQCVCAAILSLFHAHCKSLYEFADECWQLLYGLKFYQLF